MKTKNNGIYGVVYVPWWKPIKIYSKAPKWERAEYAPDQNWIFIGWAWRQKVYAVKNYYEGWICFVEDQTPENLNK